MTQTCGICCKEFLPSEEPMDGGRVGDVHVECMDNYLKSLKDDNSYEKILEDENRKLHDELEVLRKLLFELGPRLQKVFKDIEGDVDKLNSGYYERFVGCSTIKRKLKVEREYIERELLTK
jgi:hypothetical protein